MDEMAHFLFFQMARFKKATMFLLLTTILICSIVPQIREDSSDDGGRRIALKGDQCISYVLNGTMFQGGNTTFLSDKVRLCHLKTFGKDLENQCHEHFIDFNNQIKIMLQSPSLIFLQGELMVTLRVKIRQREKTNGDCFGLSCNHMYLNKFDKYLNPIGQKEIISIQSPFLFDRRSGSDDSRLFQLNDSAYSIFPVAYATYPPLTENFHLITTIWDFRNNKYFVPEFQKQMMETYLPRTLEKNWVPLVKDKELYIIRNLDPLQIVKCKIHDSCEFVSNASDFMSNPIKPDTTPLRGGTTLELYRYPYYVGYAHGTYHKGWKKRYYFYLIVLRVDPFRIVYVSDPIQIHPHLYAQFNGPKLWANVEGDFFFPTGLLIEDEDSFVVGGHINDMASLLLRMQGVKDLLENVMNNDKKTSLRNPDYSIQNYFLKRERDQNLMGLSL